MLARIRKSLADKDTNEKGFTLIELLVVMIIIGILAAIAIPVFLNQRKKAVDSSLKSDLRTVATAMETVFVDSQTYPTVATPATGGVATLTLAGTPPTTSTVQLSNGNVINNGTFTTPANHVGAYCLVGTRATNAQADSQDWYYISDKGGLQPSGTTSCG